MQHTTRFRMDPIANLAIAAVAVGFGTGALTATAAVLYFAPPALAAAPYTAPDICEMPPPSDRIGFRILLDDAKRQGVAANV